MKAIVPTLLLPALLFAACDSKKDTAHEHGTQAKTEAPADTVKKSIPKEEHALVGGTHFTVAYHAPAVRGRTIWGGLVPYGEVWVTGAHSATSIEFNKDININGTRVPAGKYAVFTIPGKDGWTVIINKNWNQHLADDYDAKEDVVRVDVAPTVLPSLQERLKYTIVDKGNTTASMDIRWEFVNISLPITLL
ncbi:MAG TPA: DUF2911 domain-containing protein [Chryseosolibacter sp.]